MGGYRKLQSDNFSNFSEFSRPRPLFTGSQNQAAAPAKVAKPANVGPFAFTFAALESGCPDLVPVDRWQAAVEDGRRFLGRWDNQAEALGWTARDLFGLQTPPAKPHPSYSRLSRYDETGLIWLLQGRPVVALTETSAAIENPTGAITTYRRHNKPALGPVGDSLDHFEPPFGRAPHDRA
jgi:hypothetical protein